MANGSSVAGGSARSRRRTGDGVGVVAEMVFKIVKVVVLVCRVGEVSDDNDDEAHAENPRWMK